MTSGQTETIKEFVTASHFDLSKVQAMLAGNPALLNVQYEWSPGDWESGIMAGSHMGSRDIVEFFLAQGVPLDICAAAMLGRTADVQAFLDANPALANARGAHQISLMFHAAMSGDTTLTELLKSAGCAEGYSHALHGAINYGHTAMVEWLLDNGAQDINVLDYQGNTPLKSALDQGHTAIADLLRSRGASEEKP